jgi:hypothetical protein
MPELGFSKARTPFSKCQNSVSWAVPQLYANKVWFVSLTII